MEQSAKTAHLLEDLQTELRMLSQQTADIIIRDDIDENHNGEPAATIILVLEGGEEFAMYSTSSVAALQTYLRGFAHAVKAAAGTYTFKPLTEAARRRRIDSVLPVVRDGRAAQFRELVSDMTRLNALQVNEEPVTVTLERMKQAIDTVARKSAALSPRFAHWRCRYKPVED